MADEDGPGKELWDNDGFYDSLWDTGSVRKSINDAVANWMAEWRITAVGNRPRDHMARDLMHASLLRNRQAPWFQKLARETPAWLRLAVEHLPPDQRRQAAQHLALRLMHGRHLHRRTCVAIERGPTQADLEDLGALRGCRPYGAMVEWAGEAERIYDFTCKKFRVCPWCLARHAVDLYDRLRRGPCRPRSGKAKHLLLGRIELVGDVGGGGDPTCLDDWGMAEVRDNWCRQLKSWARQCGAVGGILVHQVGPYRRRGWAGANYLHDLAVLAEVPTATAGLRSRLLRYVEGDDYPWSAGDLLPGDGGMASFRAATMPADHPQALRYLWAGTDAGFDLGRVGITVNGEFGPTGWGLDGAVRLLPWFLFNTMQWTGYREATKGRHLAMPFGTWRGTLPGPEPPVESLADPVIQARHRAARARTRPLRERNRDVGAEAAECRERAYGPARSAYESLLKSTNRPVGRGMLREAMARAGHPVTDRVARDLIGRLRGEFGR